MFDADEVISIHALVKRATADVEKTIIDEVISIHALVKRATYRTFVTASLGYHFNPRPREEGDKRKKPMTDEQRQFQSTPS